MRAQKKMCTFKREYARSEKNMHVQEKIRTLSRSTEKEV